MIYPFLQLPILAVCLNPGLQNVTFTQSSLLPASLCFLISLYVYISFPLSLILLLLLLLGCKLELK